MSSFLKLFLYLALPLYLLDLATKEWTVRNYAAPQLPSAVEAGFVDKTPVIPGYFDWVRIHNTGVAFGMGNGARNSNIIFGAISVAALGFILLLWWKNGFPTKTSRVAAALLISGILGNLTDRLFRGYVVDFLLVKIESKNWEWPAFNVADSCICIAAGLLFFSAFQKVPESKEVQQAS